MEKTFLYIISIMLTIIGIFYSYLGYHDPKKILKVKNLYGAGMYPKVLFTEKFIKISGLFFFFIFLSMFILLCLAFLKNILLNY